ncbi:MAG: hypothetical protein LBH95_00600 [Oscillospiraceae bacterium]|nr:hypothetical protein [Oscillospiraceae bacterium]
MNTGALPDTMYFGSAKQIKELRNRVFLTPHIGIASLFIINTGDLFPKGYICKCNISYRQWTYSNDLLAEPLKTVNALHNIVAFEKETFSGQSSGYIHVVDISKVKDRLSLFDTNDPDREVIYYGEEPLMIMKRIPHTVRWDFTFNRDDVKRFGMGTAEKVIGRRRKI